MKCSKMSTTKNMPLNWYSSMKKNQKDLKRSWNKCPLAKFLSDACLPKSIQCGQKLFEVAFKFLSPTSYSNFGNCNLIEILAPLCNVHPLSWHLYMMRNRSTFFQRSQLQPSFAIAKINIWYFVTKIVLNLLWGKNCSCGQRKTFEIRGWR